ncbi:Protein kinase-like domain [Pseudocohnilembus persalinus]|uniref:Protein kinase-like domain n=1 Tax=Pseudocohnilembus persalinus TaxID=266149 RepID=A0A0V0QLY9_PSEPJ|nr:Protein kinase-like domain [Pseudocohnilembus persalinus]|eukprot:KRX02981.1 Protein kinase-like domain [Pseudocohnilembus persalinus]
MSTYKNTKIGDYQIIEELKEFQFDFEWDMSQQAKNQLLNTKYSTTYKANDKQGNAVLIHQIKLNLVRNVEALCNELEQQKQSENPNWVKILEVYNLSKHSPPNLYIVQEYCPQSLEFQLNQQKSGMHKDDIFTIFTSICHGIDFFIQEEKKKILMDNSNGKQVQYIVYDSFLDIEPSNIFVTEEGAKIGSFLGLQAQLKEFVLAHIPGKLIYQSPQVVMQKMGIPNVQYTEKSDVWTLGVILYQMIFQKLPWSARDEKSYLKLLYRQPLRFSYEKPIGQYTKELIQNCLAFEEKDRWSFQDILSSLYLRQDGTVGIQTTSKFQNNTDAMYLSKFLGKKKNYLNYQDFVDIMGYIAPGLKQFELKLLFEQFDFNKNGKIEKSELKEQLIFGQMLEQLRNERALKLLGEMLFRKHKSNDIKQIQQDKQQTLQNLKQLFKEPQRRTLQEKTAFNLRSQVKTEFLPNNLFYLEIQKQTYFISQSKNLIEPLFSVYNFKLENQEQLNQVNSILQNQYAFTNIFNSEQTGVCQQIIVSDNLNTLYAVSQYEGVLIYDITNIFQPKYKNTYSISDKYNQYAIQYSKIINKLFLINKEQGLLYLSSDSNFNIYLQEKYPQYTNIDTGIIDENSNYLFLINSESKQLSILQINLLPNIQEISVFNFENTPNSITITDDTNIAYVSNNNNGFQILNITNKFQPKLWKTQQDPTRHF